MSTTTTTTTTTTTAGAHLVVIARRTPASLSTNTVDDDDDEQQAQPRPVMDAADEANDALDRFNHPRERRARILLALSAAAAAAKDQQNKLQITFQTPTQAASHLILYQAVHTNRLLEFLVTAWKQWDALGEAGQDPGCSMVVAATAADPTTTTTSSSSSSSSPPLIPINVPLPRDPHQRPSASVMGQVGFFCTDTCTPIFADLLDELHWDAAVVEDAVQVALQQHEPSVGVVVVAYALPTHPGHHAAQDSFGGYCYVNHAALAAHLLLGHNNNTRRVAILDVDYHCGNGTASIFYDNPNVLVVSIHCDPDYDYPFHSGFAEETGVGDGVGATLHLPLPPQTSWDNGYQQALAQAMTKITTEFRAEALVVSMGLDTHKDDPCAIRRAGFFLEGNDYWEMGQVIGKSIRDGGSKSIPTVFIQEGGYKMDRIGNAAASVVTGYCAAF